MISHRVFCLRTAVVMLALTGCSAGDLALPDPGQDGPDQPAAMKVLSGDDQQAEAGEILDDPLRVQVLDERSLPVPDVQVQFSFLGEVSGAALDPTSVETDEQGRAEAIVRLGELPGEQVIVAAVANTELPELRAQFSATAVAPGDDDKKGGKGHGDSGEGDD